MLLLPYLKNNLSHSTTTKSFAHAGSTDFFYFGGYHYVDTSSFDPKIPARYQNPSRRRCQIGFYIKKKGHFPTCGEVITHSVGRLMTLTVCDDRKDNQTVLFRYNYLEGHSYK